MGKRPKYSRDGSPRESNYVNGDYSKFYSYWESRLPVEEAIVLDLPPEAGEKIREKMKIVGC